MAIEYPEALKIAEQMSTTILGRRIVEVSIRDLTATAFRWGFSNLDKVDVADHIIESVTHHGDSMVLRLGDLNLYFGELIGRLLYHAPGEKATPKACVKFHLDDGACFTFNPTLYGWARALDNEQLDDWITAAGISPFDPAFTPDYLGLAFAEPKRRIAKQMNVIGVKYKAGGMGNGYWQEVLYLSGISPARRASDLTASDLERLHGYTLKVLNEAIAAGGSEDEVDFFGRPGAYVRKIGKHLRGAPCPVCGSTIVAKNLLGSTSYICPGCQK
jgi:formamidopyrimidine-DNA glycosylase